MRLAPPLSSRRARPRAAGPCAVALLAALALALGGHSRGVAAAAQPYAPTFSGQVVRLVARGAYPNGDPVYAMVVDATLHDPRPAAQALPDARLILATYLESFSARTAPLLPDLTRPIQPAPTTVGYLQGLAFLVNAAGTVAYRGSLMAEVLADKTMHLVVTLAPAHGSPTSTLLHLGGILALARGGRQRGVLVAPAGAPLSGLRAPQRPPVSWQAVLKGVRVPVPRMMGLAVAGPAAPRAATGPLTPALWYGLAALLVFAAALVAWWRPRRVAIVA